MGVDPSLAKAILGGGSLALRFSLSEGDSVLSRLAFALGPCLCFAGTAKIDDLRRHNQTPVKRRSIAPMI